ncbi:MAG: hypothetical protein ACI8ZM_005673, partial [Crocinitomix sp.]
MQRELWRNRWLSCLNERIAEDAFDLPPYYHDSPEMRKQFARVYNSIRLTDIRVGKL